MTMQEATWYDTLQSAVCYAVQENYTVILDRARIRAPYR